MITIATINARPATDTRTAFTGCWVILLASETGAASETLKHYAMDT